MNVFLDIETIPCQDADYAETIKQKIQLKADEEIAAIKAPGNYKDAEKIAQWLADNKEPKANEIQDKADMEIAEAIQKTALDGAYGQIVCIGYAFDDGDITKVYGKDEATILSVFFDELHAKKLTTHTGLTFIGHNLTTFDLRFIFHRAVINNVKPPECFPINPKSWDACIFDTMTYWAGHNGRIGLDRLSKALGLLGKGTEFTWQDVYPAYQRGDFEAIGEYCKDDVEMTRNVYKRLTFSS